MVVLPSVEAVIYPPKSMRLFTTSTEGAISRRFSGLNCGFFVVMGLVGGSHGGTGIAQFATVGLADRQRVGLFFSSNGVWLDQSVVCGSFKIARPCRGRRFLAGLSGRVVSGGSKLGAAIVVAGFFAILAFRVTTRVGCGVTAFGGVRTLAVPILCW